MRDVFPIGTVTKLGSLNFGKLSSRENDECSTGIFRKVTPKVVRLPVTCFHVSGAVGLLLVERICRGECLAHEGPCADDHSIASPLPMYSNSVTTSGHSHRTKSRRPSPL